MSRPGSTSTGPLASNGPSDGPCCDCICKNHGGSQPQKDDGNWVQDPHLALHRRTGTGPLLHYPPCTVLVLRLPTRDPTQTNWYRSRVFRRRTAASPHIVMMFICLYIYIDCYRSRQHPPSSPRPYTDELVQVTGLQAKATNSYRKKQFRIYGGFLCRGTRVAVPLQTPRILHPQGGRATPILPTLR